MEMIIIPIRKGGHGTRGNLFPYVLCDCVGKNAPDAMCALSLQSLKLYSFLIGPLYYGSEFNKLRPIVMIEQGE